MDYERLNKALKENGLSRRKFANMLGIGATTLQAAFNSKTSAKDREFVEKAANLLHVDAAWLAGYSERKGEFNMDDKALKIVRDYITEHLDKSDPTPTFEVYMVWKAKVLQNWKYLISSTLFDGMYYELTYNGDKKEWYLDAYKKFENRVIKED